MERISFFILTRRIKDALSLGLFMHLKKSVVNIFSNTYFENPKDLPFFNYDHEIPLIQPNLL